MRSEIYRRLIEATLARAVEKARLPKPLTLKEWVIEKRGQRFTDHPWQEQIYDAIDSADVIRTVLQMASQEAGKSEVGTNLIGCHIEHRPSSCNVMCADEEGARTWMKEKLVPMCQEKVFRGVIPDVGEKVQGQTTLHKTFPGGFVAASSGISPRRVAQRSARVLWADEIDRLPVSAGVEGDPLTLFWNRCASFSDAILLESSTPTIKGVSRIESSFLESDQRFWFVPCPDCDQSQVLKWAQVDWGKLKSGGTLKQPRYVCEHCQVGWTDAERCRAIRKGQWRATAPFHGVAGFHLSGIYSLRKPQKGHQTRMGEMVSKFLRAQKDKQRLKVWINTFLAETYDISSEREPIDTDPLLLRREVYAAPVPQGVLILTAGVDVQIDRIEVEVLGSGIDGETWGIERKVFAGDTLTPAPWLELDSFSKRTWKSAEAEHKITVMLVDSGEGRRTKAVYDWCRPRRTRRIWPAKGSSFPAQPAAVKSKNKSGLVFVGTDTIKHELYDSLKIAEPGPGYCHFPLSDDYDEEFFRQLTSEHVEQVTSRNKTISRFVLPTGVRNEALDCRVYARAAVSAIAVNWQALARVSDKKKAKPHDPAQDGDTTPIVASSPEPCQPSGRTRPRVIVRRRPPGPGGGWSPNRY